MALPEGQRGRGCSGAQVYEGKFVAQLVRVVSHGVDVPEAQLPRPVVPPALDRAPNQDGARVAEAEDDGVAYLSSPEVRLRRRGRSRRGGEERLEARGVRVTQQAVSLEGSSAGTSDLRDLEKKHKRNNENSARLDCPYHRGERGCENEKDRQTAAGTASDRLRTLQKIEQQGHAINTLHSQAEKKEELPRCITSLTSPMSAASSPTLYVSPTNKPP